MQILKRWYRCCEFEDGTIVSAAQGTLKRLIKRGQFRHCGRIVRFFKEYRA